MVLTLDITPELDSRLREEAAKLGVDPAEYVLNALQQHLQSSHTETACLSGEESRLLEEINRGLTEDEWRRYHELIEMRRAEQLTGDQHNELVEISSRVEQLNTRRIECLVELARLRGTTLPQLMDELGITPPPVI